MQRQQGLLDQEATDPGHCGSQTQVDRGSSYPHIADTAKNPQETSIYFTLILSRLEFVKAAATDTGWRY
jgi:hypothetical protein